MNRCLIIGSTCVDITIVLDHLPSFEEDVNVKSQTMSVGGCAHNVAHAINLFHVPCQLISPVGTGVYGDLVRKELKQEGIQVWKDVQAENGCCYCCVDGNGNRSFMSVQGAEYHFQKEWLESLEIDEDTWVYVCGLEIEANDPDCIVPFLEKCKGKICYAPGPRLMKVDSSLMERMLKRSNLVHLNAREGMSLTNTTTPREAITKLHDTYHTKVVMTNGAKDVLVYEDELFIVPAIPCEVVDGTGAGDSHIGSILACLCMQSDLKEAVRQANVVSSTVCQHVGACVEEQDVPWGIME